MEKTQLPLQHKRKRIIIAGVIALLLLTVLILLSVLKPNTLQTQSNLPNPKVTSQVNKTLSVGYQVNTADIPAPVSQDFTDAVLSARQDAEYKFLTSGQQKELESSSMVKNTSTPAQEQSYTIAWKDPAVLPRTSTTASSQNWHYMPYTHIYDGLLHSQIS